jgi:hypothetical protein
LLPLQQVLPFWQQAETITRLVLDDLIASLALRPGK